jgi:hypothetical protein
LLTPRGLAFWIMDDGSKQGSGLHISVYGFSNTDVDKLMFTLQDKFNLKCSIHYNRDNKPRIYIFKESPPPAQARGGGIPSPQRQGNLI